MSRPDRFLAILSSGKHEGGTALDCSGSSSRMPLAAGNDAAGEGDVDFDDGLGPDPGGTFWAAGSGVVCMGAGVLSSSCTVATSDEAFNLLELVGGSGSVLSLLEVEGGPLVAVCPAGNVGKLGPKILESWASCSVIGSSVSADA